MKNLEEYLLEKIAEECGELTQAAMKASQFGLNDFNPNENKINIEVLIKEANDVMAQMEFLKEYVQKVRVTNSHNIVEGKHWRNLWSYDELTRKQNKCSYYALTNAYNRGKLKLQPSELEYLDNKSAEHKELVSKEIIERNLVEDDLEGLNKRENK